MKLDVGIGGRGRGLGEGDWRPGRGWREERIEILQERVQ